jgi:indolepyruvate ferredoxin oxidoreductase
MTDLAPSTSTPVSIRPKYSLSDRFTASSGTVFASGVQAIARILVEQLRVDRANGLNTSAFASGYPGSPLASLDRELATAAKLMAGEAPFVFQPGLNEELAAAAVMGSQLALNHGDATVDGVIGLWFGKAPGIDRACDAIRHAQFGGTHAKGGVLLVVGDDPAAKSSTLPSSSDATLMDLHVPLLYPINVQDTLDLGRHGIALSRASGLWAGLKMVASVADGTATITLDPSRVRPIIPEWLVNGVPFVPKPSARFLPPHSLEQEREIVEVRMEIAREYGLINKLNSVTVDPGSSARIGIAACGYTSSEVREALSRLGLHTDTQIANAGIRLMVLRMPVPLDPSDVRNFTRGLQEIIIVEEKNPTLELLFKDALWGGSDRPIIVGKQDVDGSTLFPRTGHLDADAMLAPLRTRLRAYLPDESLAPLPQVARPTIELATARSPWFCSGCPHHWGTKVPEGSISGAGIGCHGMTLLQPEERVGQIDVLGAMGSEGLAWVGMAPFVKRTHFIQNIGDGTFAHSGQLAVQASIAAKVNVTYKLLYNGAIAMTGGQDAQGQLSVAQIATMMLTQGVKRVLVTTDDTAKYKRVTLPRGVEVWDRTRIVEAQELLREIPGTTMLIHDQACAAELRRDRKRGLVATPTFRVVINERVCEGCGHCGETSGCLSVQPLDTEFGRKTMIDQTSCNLDATCLQGDCPSFMTVEIDPTNTKKPHAHSVSAPTTFPSPTMSQGDDCTIRLAGIGGTGVVTVSQVLGTAAMLEGKHSIGLDQTGLSQKAGPVVSDIRITAKPIDGSNKAGTATVHVLLALDLLVGASDANIKSLIPGTSRVIGSTATAPTGKTVIDPRVASPTVALLTERLGEACGSNPTTFDASHLTTTLLGDATTANIAVLGAAFQLGCIPLTADALEQAITLNGVAVEKNLNAFRWGRTVVSDPSRVEHELAKATPRLPASKTKVLPPRLQARISSIARSDESRSLLSSRAIELVAYQNDGCAARYLTVIERVATKEQALGLTEELSIAVARHLFTLTAYKDEYEVARLLTAPESIAAAEAVGGPGAQMTWKLHPPMLKALGRKDKIGFGHRTRPVLVTLAKGKRLRGTRFDPFGRTEMRRLERALVVDYVAVVDRLLGSLHTDNLHEAVRIASLPDIVRGYEDRKLKRVSEYRAELHRSLQAWPA